MSVPAIADSPADAAGTKCAARERIRARLAHVHLPTMVDARGIDDEPEAEATRPSATTETACAAMGRATGGDAE